MIDAPAPTPATAEQRWRMPRMDLRSAVRAHGLEAIAFLGIFVVACVIRLVNLGTIPRVVAGDETDTIQDAIHINGGLGPGIIAFDWSQSPSLGIYPLAWIIRIFGDSVADVRLYCVIFSLLTIIIFYLLARETVNAPAALAATLLLATNVWFLNFSRTLWYTTNSPFIAVGACWTLTRALKSVDRRRRWIWWLATALFVTAGLYGYSSARFVALSVAVVAIFAAVMRFAPRRETLIGLAAAAVISAVLFAPMAKFIYDHYDVFTRRADTVSVFKVREPDGSFKNGWTVAWDNVEPVYRGLVFNDGLQTQRGPYNARYHPPNRAALEILGAHLFLAGVIIAAFRWRRTYVWFPFIIPAALVNIFSTATPDYARSLIFAPFYFLFIAITFDEVLRHRWRFAPKPLLLAAIAAITIFIAQHDVRLYFDWQSDITTQAQRMPGIDHCEYPSFIALVNEATETGKKTGSARLVGGEIFQPVRDELHCSPVVEAQGGYTDQKTTPP
jgi:4-amino-4-deoxy-L-arabinose transferase-like glycosyltransferase